MTAITREIRRSWPWTLVEGNCKRHARLKVLRTVAEALEAALERSTPKGARKVARRRR